MEYIVNILWFILGLLCYYLERLFNLPFTTLFIIVSLILLYLMYRNERDN